VTYDPYQVPVNPGQPSQHPHILASMMRPPPPRHGRPRRSGRASIIVAAMLLLTAGVGTVAYVVFQRTPAGHAVSDALGLGHTYTQAEADAVRRLPIVDSAGRHHLHTGVRASACSLSRRCAESFSARGDPHPSRLWVNPKKISVAASGTPVR